MSSEQATDDNVVQFLSQEEYEKSVQDHMERTLGHMAGGQGRMVVPRSENFSRKDVVASFQAAFEAVGGTTRLALWANEHYTEFAKLYARLLPSQASSALGEAQVHKVLHVLPRSALDE